MTRAAAGKVADLDGARAAVAKWRAAGERVVLARGPFDLLDAGAVRHLQGARGHGRLVVGVPDDAAAASGPGTPVLPLEDRIALVAALRAVDLVVAMALPHAAALIAALRPDACAFAPTDPATDAEQAAAAAAGAALLATGDPDFGPERAPAARLRARRGGGRA